MPSGMGAVPEEHDVAGAVTGRRHIVAVEHDRAFQDQDGLVEIIVPVELALAALPDHGGSHPVRTLGQDAGLRRRIAFDDPGGFDRPRRQIDGEIAGFNGRTIHRKTPNENVRNRKAQSGAAWRSCKVNYNLLIFPYGFRFNQSNRVAVPSDFPEEIRAKPADRAGWRMPPGPAAIRHPGSAPAPARATTDRARRLSAPTPRRPGDDAC